MEGQEAHPVARHRQHRRCRRKPRGVGFHQHGVRQWKRALRDRKDRVRDRTEGARPWEQGDEDSPRFAPRKEMFKLMGAAKQVARADDEEQLTKAAEILKDARRKLYGLLAEE